MGVWHGSYRNTSTLYSYALRFQDLRINSSPLDKLVAIFVDDIFKFIFMNEKLRILIRISLKFVPDGPIDNKSALVQVMAWRRTGGKLLREPMLDEFTDA